MSFFGVLCCLFTRCVVLLYEFVMCSQMGVCVGFVMLICGAGKEKEGYHLHSSC